MIKIGIPYPDIWRPWADHDEERKNSICEMLKKLDLKKGYIAVLARFSMKELDWYWNYPFIFHEFDNLNLRGVYLDQYFGKGGDSIATVGLGDIAVFHVLVRDDITVQNFIFRLAENRNELQKTLISTRNNIIKIAGG